MNRSNVKWRLLHERSGYAVTSQPRNALLSSAVHESVSLTGEKHIISRVRSCLKLSRPRIGRMMHSFGGLRVTTIPLFLASGLNSRQTFLSSSRHCSSHEEAFVSKPNTVSSHPVGDAENSGEDSAQGEASRKGECVDCETSMAMIRTILQHLTHGLQNEICETSNLGSKMNELNFLKEDKSFSSDMTASEPLVALRVLQSPHSDSEALKESGNSDDSSARTVLLPLRKLAHYLLSCVSNVTLQASRKEISATTASLLSLIHQLDPATLLGHENLCTLIEILNDTDHFMHAVLPTTSDPTIDQEPRILSASRSVLQTNGEGFRALSRLLTTKAYHLLKSLRVVERFAECSVTPASSWVPLKHITAAHIQEASVFIHTIRTLRRLQHNNLAYSMKINDARDPCSLPDFVNEANSVALAKVPQFTQIDLLHSALVERHMIPFLFEKTPSNTAARSFAYFRAIISAQLLSLYAQFPELGKTSIPLLPKCVRVENLVLMRTQLQERGLVKSGQTEEPTLTSHTLVSAIFLQYASNLDVTEVDASILEIVWSHLPSLTLGLSRTSEIVVPETLASLLGVSASSLSEAVTRAMGNIGSLATRFAKRIVKSSDFPSSNTLPIVFWHVTQTLEELSGSKLFKAVNQSESELTPSQNIFSESFKPFTQTLCRFLLSLTVSLSPIANSECPQPSTWFGESRNALNSLGVSLHPSQKSAELFHVHPSLLQCIRSMTNLIQFQPFLQALNVKPESASIVLKQTCAHLKRYLGYANSLHKSSSNLEFIKLSTQILVSLGKAGVWVKKNSAETFDELSRPMGELAEHISSCLAASSCAKCWWAMTDTNADFKIILGDLSNVLPEIQSLFLGSKHVFLKDLQEHLVVSSEPSDEHSLTLNQVLESFSTDDADATNELLEKQWAQLQPQLTIPMVLKSNAEDVFSLITRLQKIHRALSETDEGFQSLFQGVFCIFLRKNFGDVLLTSPPEVVSESPSSEPVLHQLGHLVELGECCVLFRDRSRFLRFILPRVLRGVSTITLPQVESVLRQLYQLGITDEDFAGCSTQALLPACLSPELTENIAEKTPQSSLVSFSSLLQTQTTQECNLVLCSPSLYPGVEDVFCQRLLALGQSLGPSSALGLLLHFCAVFHNRLSLPRERLDVIALAALEVVRRPTVLDTALGVLHERLCAARLGEGGKVSASSSGGSTSSSDAPSSREKPHQPNAELIPETEAELATIAYANPPRATLYVLCRAALSDPTALAEPFTDQNSEGIEDNDTNSAGIALSESQLRILKVVECVTHFYVRTDKSLLEALVVNLGESLEGLVAARRLEASSLENAHSKFVPALRWVLTTLHAVTHVDTSASLHSIALPEDIPSTTWIGWNYSLYSRAQSLLPSDLRARLLGAVLPSLAKVLVEFPPKDTHFAIETLTSREWVMLCVLLNSYNPWEALPTRASSDDALSVSLHTSLGPVEMSHLAEATARSLSALLDRGTQLTGDSSHTLSHLHFELSQLVQLNPYLAHSILYAQPTGATQPAHGAPTTAPSLLSWALFLRALGPFYKPLSNPSSIQPSKPFTNVFPSPPPESSSSLSAIVSPDFLVRQLCHLSHPPPVLLEVAALLRQAVYEVPPPVLLHLAAALTHTALEQHAPALSPSGECPQPRRKETEVLGRTAGSEGMASPTGSKDSGETASREGQLMEERSPTQSMFRSLTSVALGKTAQEDVPKTGQFAFLAGTALGLLQPGSRATTLFSAFLEDWLDVFASVIEPHLEELTAGEFVVFLRVMTSARMSDKESLLHAAVKSVKRRCPTHYGDYFRRGFTSKDTIPVRRYTLIPSELIDVLKCLTELRQECHGLLQTALPALRVALRLSVPSENRTNVGGGPPYYAAPALTALSLHNLESLLFVAHCASLRDVSLLVTVITRVGEWLQAGVPIAPRQITYTLCLLASNASLLAAFTRKVREQSNDPTPSENEPHEDEKQPQPVSTPLTPEQPYHPDGTLAPHLASQALHNLQGAILDLLEWLTDIADSLQADESVLLLDALARLSKGIATLLHLPSPAESTQVIQTAVEAVLRRVEALLPVLPPAPLSAICAALSRLHPLRYESTLAALADRILEHPEGFVRGHDIVRVLHAFGRLRVPHKGLFAVLADRLRLRATRASLSPTDAVLAIQAFGEARHLDEPRVRELASACVGERGRLGHVDVLVALTAMAKLRVHHEGFFRAMAERVVELVQEFSLPQLALLLHAFARMNLTHGEMVAAVMGRITEEMEEIDGKTTANVLVSLGEIEYARIEVWTALADHISSSPANTATLTVRNVEDLCTLCQRTNWCHEPLLMSLAEHLANLAENQPESSSGLSNIVSPAVARLLLDTLGIFLLNHPHARKVLSPLASAASLENKGL